MAKLPYSKMPRLIGPGNYEIDVFWSSLGFTFTNWTESYGLNLDPDYQRPHVWTEAQQRAYVEFVIMGGQSGKILLFNCPGWNSRTSNMGPIELVDGKQRLHAVQLFMDDRLTVFDSYPEIGPTLYSEMELIRDLVCRFKVYVNGLDTRAEVLQWYLELNTGGTPHTDTEINKVRGMLWQERASPSPRVPDKIDTGDYVPAPAPKAKKGRKA